jgi:hypothetical protein
MLLKNGQATRPPNVNIFCFAAEHVPYDYIKILLIGRLRQYGNMVLLSNAYMNKQIRPLIPEESFWIALRGRSIFFSDFRLYCQ